MLIKKSDLLIDKFSGLRWTMKKAGRIVYFIRLTEYIFIIYHSYVKLTKKIYDSKIV